MGVDSFRTTSDTEVILRAYRKWGPEALTHLRGMFAFALWDAERGMLFCARDRFGMKPFYYAVVDGIFLFASEAKALLPFLPSIETDPEGLRDYLTFVLLDGKSSQGRSRAAGPGLRLWCRRRCRIHALDSTSRRTRPHSLYFEGAAGATFDRSGSPLPRTVAPTSWRADSASSRPGPDAARPADGLHVVSRLAAIRGDEYARAPPTIAATTPAGSPWMTSP